MNLAAAAARHKFGRALRAAREASAGTGRKVQQIDLARALGRKSYNRVSQLERGLSWPTDEEWPVICKTLRMDAVTKAALSAMRDAGMAITEAWWDAYDGVVSPTLIKFVAHEDAASKMTTLAGNVLPGLLQTPDYARSQVLPFSGTVMTKDDAGRSAAMRSQRRMIFERTPPPQVEAMFSEGALHQMVGGVEVMLDQLDALIEDGRTGRVQFRIIPFTAPTTLTYMFTLLEFAGEGDSPVVVFDQVTGMDFKDKPGEIREVRASVDALRNVALDEVSSLELMKRKRKELARG
ncbi:DNA-binding protein [Streptomyces zinciresistens K42]|uniref:DNA-binding protein n=1 Tax=Streptomyces zinciresistens K42 TaxID=700597 RepID=G2GM52_9ACTN|nr:DNA-binding protein [Streptomyces zinciresistens K42]